MVRSYVGVDKSVTMKEINCLGTTTVLCSDGNECTEDVCDDNHRKLHEEPESAGRDLLR
jgi:hypothetical protein